MVQKTVLSLVAISLAIAGAEAKSGLRTLQQKPAFPCTGSCLQANNPAYGFIDVPFAPPCWVDDGSHFSCYLHTVQGNCDIWPGAASNVIDCAKNPSPTNAPVTGTPVTGTPDTKTPTTDGPITKAPINNPTNAPTSPSPTPADLELIYSDEFSSSQVQGNNWNIVTGRGPNNDGWGNNEAETYSSDPANVFISQGHLSLQATNDGGSIKSGRVDTYGKWSFKPEQGLGIRVEFNARVPVQQGVWPALWLLPESVVTGANPWPNDGELDLLEVLGTNGPRAAGSINFGKNANGNLCHNWATAYSFSDQAHLQDLHDNFHVYALEWYHDRISYFIDNEVMGSLNATTTLTCGGQTIDWPFNGDSNWFVIMNLAVGGLPVGNAPSGGYPYTMDVDYVRVYHITY